MPDRPLACDGWREHVAGRVVAQVTPAEDSALDAHLLGCDACRAEVEDLLAVSAVALGADPLGRSASCSDPEPAPDLGDRVVARVRRHRRRRRLVWGGAVVAAVALVAVVLRPDRGSVEPSTEGDPVAFATRPDGVEATAVMAPDGDGSLVQLTAQGLDPDVTYALWLTPAGGRYANRVPAGTFRPDADGRVVVRLHSSLPPTEADRVWVTDGDGDVTLDTE